MALSEMAMGEGHPSTYSKPEMAATTRRIELSEMVYGPDQPGLEVPIAPSTNDHDHGPDA
jgi:hypothetical protein